jgi:hypothetical protein
MAISSGSREAWLLRTTTPSSESGNLPTYARYPAQARAAVPDTPQATILVDHESEGVSEPGAVPELGLLLHPPKRGGVTDAM